MTDPELLQSFVSEARDMLDEIEPILIEVQQHSDAGGEVDTEAINSVFRLFHSLKGSAGFLQLQNVANLTHEAETLLDLFRKGRGKISSENTALLCRALDLIHEMLGVIDADLTDETFGEATIDLVEQLRSAIQKAKGGRKRKASRKKKKAAPSPDAAPARPAEPGATPARTTRPVPPPEGAVEQLTVTEDMVRAFVAEGDELLEQAEQSLLAVQSDPEEIDDPLKAAFRAIHSFKGNCGFLGFSDILQLSHKSETILQALQEKALAFDESVIDIVLKIVDVIRDTIAAIQKGGNGTVQGCEVLVELLDEVLADAGPLSTGTESGGKKPKIIIVDDERNLLELLVRALSGPYRCTTVTTADEALTRIREEDEGYALLITDLKMDGMDGIELIQRTREFKPHLPILVITGYGDKEVVVRLMDMGVEEYLDKPFELAQLHAKVESALKKARDRAAAPRARTAPGSGDTRVRQITRRDIRVDLDKLDSLINLVGELVIAEAMVIRNPDLEGLELENFEGASHQLHRVALELQDVAMSLRMVPLAASFRKLIRLVHDLSTKAKKQVKLALHGEDTEVDKTVIEQIADPLVHIVRNAIDHGMEPPAERRAVGKADTALLTVEARHEGGEVWILISDDGRGLDRERILARGIERGLVPGDGQELSDEAVYRLIFEPGFSTAETVTDISGRGVGMDVVKKNLERLKGRVDIRATPGKGTTVILRIPLTLAIIEGMLVRVGKAQYTIPLLSIRESFRPEPGTITRTMDGSEVARVREELIPILRVHELFKRTPDSTDLESGILIIVEDGDRALCLFVDEILGQQQTVIKGLSGYVGEADCISGCTILGTGEVSLILDIGSIIEKAQAQGETTADTLAQGKGEPS